MMPGFEQLTAEQASLLGVRGELALKVRHRLLRALRQPGSFDDGLVRGDWQD